MVTAGPVVTALSVVMVSMVLRGLLLGSTEPMAVTVVLVVPAVMLALVVSRVLVAVRPVRVPRVRMGPRVVVVMPVMVAWVVAV